MSVLSPISILPPEILTRIFHFLAIEEPPCSDEQGLGWIRAATHVCRLWRQVALGDSSLWARIEGFPTDTKLALISEMLARAGNALLDIDIDTEETSSPEVLHMFLPHLFHTRELRLHSLSMLHSESVLDIYSQEAPALEHLQLDMISFIPFRKISGSTLFKGRAPKLRTISLIQVLIPWSLIPRGQLTQLTITFMFEEFSDGPSESYGDLNQLIDLLANSPELEVLSLSSCLPSRLSRFLHGQTIHLPRLSRLLLAGSSSRIMNLLKMLKFSSSATLHCHCLFENTPNDHLLLPIVSAHLQSPSPVEFKNLSVTINCKHRSLEVAAWTSLPRLGMRLSRVFESDVDQEEFNLSFFRLPEHGNWTDIIGRVCKMLPISNLEFLSISASDVLDRVNLVELFKHCTKVSALRAHGSGTSGLVQALTTPKVANTNTGPVGKGKQKKRDSKDSTAPIAPAPLFPNLMFLSLKRLDFAENGYPSGTLFDVIENGLRQRKVEYSAPLRMLRIEQCGISARRTKALQKLVQNFRWDRKTSFPDGPEGFPVHELIDGDNSNTDEPASRPWWEDFIDSTTNGK